MDYAHRSDSDLVELAQAGWRGAFAVLVHRHAATIHAAVEGDADPERSTVEVFVDAMRGLPYQDPALPVLPWLLEFAGVPDIPTAAGALTPEQLDDIWRRIDRHWPDGRLHRAHPRRRLALLIAGLVVASALIPVAVFAVSTMPADVEVADELQAFPVEVEEPVVEETEEPEPLPTYSFPSAPEDSPPPVEEAAAEAPAPAPAPAPPPPPSPSPEPVPEPEPEPEPEPSPQPTATTEPEPAPSPTDPAEALPVEPPDG